jgi:anti-sigma-K factor RskA
VSELDPLDKLLRECEPPEPGAELDARVLSAYRAHLTQPESRGFWRRFWSLRVSVPAPALIAAAIALVAVFFWVRPAAQPATAEAPGAVTRLNASGFQPLPNGEARVVPAMEVRK